MRSRRNPSKTSISIPLHDLSSSQNPELESLSSSRNSTSSLPNNQLTTIADTRHSARLLVILPLAIHFLGSVAVAVTVSRYLHDRQFYLERQPRIRLADGTYDSNELGRHNLLQSDVTTLLSGLLMVIRWVAAAWATPLCWRVVFLLAEKYGLRYRDIEWTTNYGILPPATHFKRPFNLLLGLILILTLAPFPASPLLTGAISWIPSSSNVELSYHPTVNLTGALSNETGTVFTYSGEYHATFPTDVVKNFNTAWNEATEERIFKRVVPSTAHLTINSTIENVVLPYFAVTKIEWFPELEDDTFELFEIMRQDRANFPHFPGKMSQPGAVAIIVKYTSFEGANTVVLDQIPSTWEMVINVAKELAPQNCNSSSMVLSSNTTISPFYLAFNSTKGYVYEGKLSGCFVYAKVTYSAGSGHCRSCQIISPSTVQNNTELDNLKSKEGDPALTSALGDIPQYIINMTPLKNSLPDLANGIEDYITALLIRLYSALWTSWTDAYGVGHVQSSRYSPAISTLKAEVDQTRVYAWLCLQISATIAGLAFLWLQSTSQYPLLIDTSMAAFDVDSTEVFAPSGTSNNGKDNVLRIEPKNDRWRVVVATGGSHHGLD